MRRLLAWFAMIAATVPTLAQAAAAAADRPPMTPTREASVLYRITKAGVAPVEVRITTRVGGSPMRVDMPEARMMVNSELLANCDIV